MGEREEALDRIDAAIGRVANEASAIEKELTRLRAIEKAAREVVSAFPSRLPEYGYWTPSLVAAADSLDKLRDLISEDGQ